MVKHEYQDDALCGLGCGLAMTSITSLARGNALL
jgi:hypothetical protein